MTNIIEVRAMIELVVGETYRQRVNSKQGYEDWEYTGNTQDTPMGIWYAFKNDLGVYWFDEEDLKDFERL